jgi:NDP-sugar pyrophosphorylase family protein
MRHIDYGLGAFHKRAFAPWPSGATFDLADVYRGVLAADDLAGFEVPGRFYEIGSPAGLEETRAHLTGKATTTP